MRTTTPKNGLNVIIIVACVAINVLDNLHDSIIEVVILVVKDELHEVLVVPDDVTTYAG